MSKEFTNGKFITLISELAQDLADYHGSDLTEEDFKDYNKFQEIMACVTDLTYIYIQGLKMFIWAEYAGIIDELEDQAHQEYVDSGQADYDERVDAAMKGE